MPARVLLLHGYLGSGLNWCRVQDELQLVPGIEALAPDLLGHGDSALRGTPYSLEALTADILSVAESFRPTHVVGHSLGGLVALALGAAISLDSVGVIGLPVFASTREGYAAQAHRSLAARPFVLVHRRTHAICAAADRWPRLWLPLAQRLMPRRPPATVRGLVRHSAESHFAALENVVFAGLAGELAARSGCRVAALHGVADRVAPMTPARVLAASAGWPFEAVPQGGHQLPIERPRLVADWIRRAVVAGM